jgi:hypothetical protein
MNLVQVHIVGAEASQAGVDFREDGLARQAADVRTLAQGKNTLVAMTTSSRRVKSFNARPMISSEVPSE